MTVTPGKAAARRGLCLDEEQVEQRQNEQDIYNQAVDSIRSQKKENERKYFSQKTVKEEGRGRRNQPIQSMKKNEI
jgi:hypothetical protein